ncbi:helix-turn-helix domain-containing protein [Paenibacillus sp. GXUN7292]|uniref:helix-turn-helix domain-containing protein n=1 Tax=Paenibacillus sp. GXUN7292 TaxID=3422499 RepID=UPI003D7C5562
MQSILAQPLTIMTYNRDLVERKTNLKNGTETLRYYRKITNEQRQKIIQYERDGRMGTYIRRDQDDIYFSEGDVERFSLDTIGYHPIPFREGNFTMVSNYLLDFWGYFLKPTGVHLYTLLRRHCYNKDYCYVSTSTLATKMGIKSRDTVKTHLDLLESYGFIFQFLVKNEKNMDEAPITKVRNHIPMLTAELIQQLPTALRKDHDRLVHELSEISQATDLIKPFVNVEQVYESFVTKGEIREPNHLAKETELQQVKLDHLASRMDETDRKILDMLAERLLGESWDNHVIDTFVKPLILHYDRDRRTGVSAINIYCSNSVIHQFVTTTLRTRIIHYLTQYYGQLMVKDVNFILVH